LGLFETRLDVYINMWKIDDVFVFKDYAGRDRIAKILSIYKNQWNIIIMGPRGTFRQKNIVNSSHMKVRARKIIGKEYEFYEIFWENV